MKKVVSVLFKKDCEFLEDYCHVVKRGWFSTVYTTYFNGGYNLKVYHNIFGFYDPRTWYIKRFLNFLDDLIAEPNPESWIKCTTSLKSPLHQLLLLLGVPVYLHHGRPTFFCKIDDLGISVYVEGDHTAPRQHIVLPANYIECDEVVALNKLQQKKS